MAEFVDNGRPLWPALFITDLGTPASYTPTAKTGDWQNGYANTGTFGSGGGLPTIAVPSVFGPTKGVTRTVDNTKLTSGYPAITVATGTDPAKNTWTGVPDTPPGGFSKYSDQGYGSEVRWSVDTLTNAGVLQSGHSYRMEFMVHDGDQNQSGGDTGEACLTVYAQ